MNHVDLIGRLTADPELKRTANGNSACNFTLAVNRYKKVEGQPDADFIRCKAFGKTAENLCRYQHKGSLIAVSGSIQTGSYMKEAQKVYTTDILIASVEFLEKKENGAQTGFTGANSGYQQQQTGYNQPYQGNQGYAQPVQAGYQPYGQAPQAAQSQATEYDWNYNKYDQNGNLNPAPQPQDALGISSDDLPF